MNERISFFIDGFNLYHALKNYNNNRYKWLNLYQLCQCFITKNQKIANIYYFSAFSIWNKEKVKKHKKYIEALKTENIIFVKGVFKKKTITCRKCYMTFKTHEEKETDVNIALKLAEYAYKDQFDTGIIVSADSDLIPAVKLCQSLFKKKIGLLLPPFSRSISLSKQCDFYQKIKERQVQSSLFPDKVEGKNAIISCPDRWL